ncbi:Spx/MgsR family RNA polymerase-binding regulatory protein [Virgibacillus soli]|uniref:Spx/MgsR family RNA polymerase-binding regulatory protein n=1 Tax=Paracerasibacillus soli TaxID=480284 RepID=A0ABU5CTI8_9BACI|nr:Spx/MgsR family RNA polymerase-binding regulatory protein [Virgibacillus soli]MDY0409686.1 Spx/MgsR family RNA polymerase-binding regulatory protein [Virgibacillus soli]
MTVQVFGLACGSTRKARDWFRRHKIPFTERNVKREPLTLSELQQILALTVEGTDEIISTRSKVYKELTQDIDALSLNELLELFQQYPALLRSPIIIDHKRIQVGYNEEEIRQFLPRETRQRQWIKWRAENFIPVKGSY